jgi:hypothetical protein
LPQVNEIVITFPSTFWALKFEKICKEIGKPIKIVPVPREISSSCGISALFNKDILQEIYEIIKKHCLEIEDIYLFNDKGWHLC